MIHVCPLSQLRQTVAATRASHVVTMIKRLDRIERPENITPECHLILGMDDISEPLEGYIIPDDEHITKLLSFVQGWDRAAPIVIHCFAGISRSTAGAYVA